MFIILLWLSSCMPPGNVGVDLPAADAGETVGGDAWEDSAQDTPGDATMEIAADTCQPACGGRECGDDGCGGSCGDCLPGFLCGDGGQCIHDCQAACEGQDCGDGGTGGACVCGECPGGYGCDASGACTAECGVLCEGRECGPAGDEAECDCGTCGEWQVCTDGTCVLDCPTICEAVECTPEWAEDLCQCGTCDDGNSCTTDTCDPEGTCAHQGLSGISCEDGDLCTYNGICEAGICASTPTACADENPCTDDTCDPGTGDCVFMPNEAPCDDGDPCTVGDSCGGGACAGIAVDCSCDTDADCDKLEDGNLCNGTLFCNTGLLPFLCQVDQDTVIECPEPPPEDPDGPCLDPVCDPASGDCSFVDADDGAPCADPNLCTLGDVCEKGVCTGGMEANCNDGNPCTDDWCAPSEGCLHGPNSAPCDDGNPCTVGDGCADSECQHGPAPDCDDGNPCTDDACDPLSGCVHPANLAACSDQNACTFNDACSGGACVGGPALVCNDGNPCTDDGCEPQSGCIATPNAAPCSDGDPCTTGDTCSEGACLGTGEQGCDDDNVCTLDLCTPGGGCVHLPATGACDDGNTCSLGDHCVDGACQPTGSDACNDGNPCTTDSCVPASGCVHDNNTVACDDGDKCTLQDQCVDGSCHGLVDLVCQDGNPCTGDACDPLSGCLHPPVPGGCDDGNPCTSGDYCAAGSCVPAGTATCDDENPCTTDWCDPATGCKHGWNTLPCNDGSACTWQDRCTDSACMGQKQVSCEDWNPCTDDACAPLEGCLHTFNSASCDDFNECTQGDQCVAGVCKGQGSLECDDGNPCTKDICLLEGGCAHEELSGNACSDGDPCTLSDVCTDGACTPGAALDCDDGNPCTDDACEDGACLNDPNEEPCTDGNACTTGDHCFEGTCVHGQVLPCGDGNPCTDDWCDPATGCKTVDNQQICNDGNACTTGDHCAGGACVGTGTIQCNDGNPCTDDGCDVKGGCTHVPNTDPCNDGNLCTTGDHCGGGACLAGGALSCDDANACTQDSCGPATGCAHAPVTAPCSDGNPCTTGDACVNGACKPGAPLVCNDQNPCTDDACQGGQCLFKPNTLECDDGNACTLGDRCTAGQCLYTELLPCDDGNPCTDDWCDPEGGCAALPNNIPCTDGDACTGEDVCQDEQCAGMVEVDCDDFNECTDDACDPLIGCVYGFAAGSCEDGNPCTLEDHCQAGKCVAGATETCDDENPCTTDACSPLEGCLNEPNSIPCSDGDECTAKDVCTGGECLGEYLDCDDWNPCTDDGCDPDTGCTHVPNTEPCDDQNECTTEDACVNSLCVGLGSLECDDENPCTKDVCLPAGGCDNQPLAGTACSDDDPCTLNDKCEDGWCVPGPTRDCDDLNWCTDDECDGLTGACVNAPNQGDCDDGNACTVGDHCEGGACVFTGAEDCNDGEPCTIDACDPWVGCTYVNTGDPCSDGDACTLGDHCAWGFCEPGPELPCDDGNPCTDDSCDSQTGCVFAFNQDPCDDGNLCTEGDHCAGGNCVAQSATLCDDVNPCTLDSCTPASGCQNVPVAKPCSDGSLCTIGDHCESGECVPTGELDCEDGNPCTADACEAATGCTHAAVPGDCEDGNACTTGDQCQGGACKGGPPESCDDDNPCTDDGCDPLSGCVFLENTDPCDDGDACTEGDVCWGGECLPGDPPDCDDDNPCTDDGCDALSGCSYEDNQELCDDGDLCTASDQCEGGTCQGGPEVSCDDTLDCTVDSCHPVKGCLYLPIDALCSDGIACTIDTCSTDSGCEHLEVPVDCQVGPWSPWGSCGSVDGSCTGGRTRTRTITVAAACGGEPCPILEETEGCPLPAGSSCQDSAFCTAFDTCDQDGVCAGIPVDAVCNDGSGCTIDSCTPGHPEADEDGCLHVNVPVDCQVSAWGSWGNCDQEGDTCDGLRVRTRTVLLPPACDGEPCPPLEETGDCLVPPETPCDDQDPCTAGDECDALGSCAGVNVPVDCVVSPWGQWGDCLPVDDSCVGARTRLRTVLTPDACGGKACPALEESEDCLLPETSPCDDSEECTLLDQCDGDGVCTGTPAELIPLAQGGCDDGDPCTADSCLEGGSCDHVDDCPGVPVINEVDYDQPGTDTMEFVEVLNPGPSAVALDLFRLELVNGADGTIYGTFSLDQGLPSRRLDAGKRLVIGSVGVIAALPAGTRSIPLGTVTIQNGAPDGLRIVRKTGSVFVDGVHYEGTMPTVGEGGTAPTDSGTGALGLSRCPDGGDTNNNAVDFLLLPPTPGMVNAPCP